MRWKIVGTLLVGALAGAGTDPNSAPQSKHGIRMPLSEFLKLIPPPEPEEAKPPPFSAGLSSGELTVAIETPDGTPARARVTARYAVAVPGGTWSRFSILGTAASLVSVTLDGAKPTIAAEGAWYVLLTDSAGAHALDLTFTVPVAMNKGVSEVALPLAPSAGATLTATVPGDMKVTVVPAAGVTRTFADGKTTAAAALPAASDTGAPQAVHIAWEPSVLPPVVAESKVYAQVDRLVSIAERRIRVLAVCRFSILHAGIQKLIVDVPDDADVTRVAGDRLATWKILRAAEGAASRTTSRPATGTQRIEVSLEYPAAGPYLLAIELERGIQPEDERVVVPAVVVENVERQTGDVACEAWSNAELASEPGTPTLDVRQAPVFLRDAATAPVVLAYRPAKPTDEVAIRVRRLVSEEGLSAIVDVADFETLVTRDGRRLTRAIYAVRNRNAQFLRVRLPDGVNVWTATVAGRSTKLADDGRGGVLVPLASPSAERRTLEPFPVLLVCFQSGAPLATRGSDTLRVDLPTVSVPVRYATFHLRVPEPFAFDTKRTGGTLDYRDVLYQEMEALWPVGARYVTNLKPVVDAGVVGYQPKDGQRFQTKLSASDVAGAQVNPNQSRTDLLRNWASNYGKGGVQERFYNEAFTQVFEEPSASEIAEEGKVLVLAEIPEAKRFSSSTGGTEALRSYQERESIRWDHFVAQARARLNEAYALMRANKFREAKGILENIIITINLEAFPESQVAEYRAVTNRALETCNAQIQAEDQREREWELRMARVGEHGQIGPYAAEVQKKVDALVDQAIGFMRNHNYENTYKAADQALVFNPQSTEARIIRDQAQMWASTTASERDLIPRDLDIANMIFEVEKSRVPAAGVVEYPEDWSNLEDRRKKYDVVTSQVPTLRPSVPQAPVVDVPAVGRVYKFERFLVSEGPLFVEIPYRGTTE